MNMLKYISTDFFQIISTTHSPKWQLFLQGRIILSMKELEEIMKLTEEELKKSNNQSHE